MTLVEAQTLTLRVLKQVMEEKLDHHNVQLALVSRWSLRLLLGLYSSFKVTPETGFEILDEKKLKEAIERM